MTEIDQATGAVLGTIPVGMGPAIVTVSPDGSRLYTANWGDNTISVIDTSTHAVTSIPVGSRPWVETMTADGATLYVGLNANAIAAISTATETLTRTIATSQAAVSVIPSPDRATLYVAFLDNTIRAVSASDGGVVQPALGVGTSPGWIAITPDGGTVYTLNLLSADVSVVDTASWRVIATVALGGGAYPIFGAVTPDGAVLGVTDFGTNTVSFVGTSSQAITHAPTTAGRPVGIGFSLDGSRAYVTDYGSGSNSVFPLTLTASFLTPAGFGGAIDGPGEVTVFDTTTGSAIGKPIPLGKGPTSVVVGPK